MRGYLLDSCAISDGRKPQHYPKLATWLATGEPEQTYLSVATIAEIKFGVARHRDDAQRGILGSWLLEIINAFDKRIIELDVSVALGWACFDITLNARVLRIPLLTPLLPQRRFVTNSRSSRATSGSSGAPARQSSILGSEQDANDQSRRNLSVPQPENDTA